MNKEIGGMTAELYREIVDVIDERVREIKVTREDFDRLEAAMACLVEAQARTDQTVERLAEAQARTDQTVERLAEAQARTDQTVERLAEAQARTDQTVERLAEAQARTDQTVERLVQVQARTEERLTRLEEAVEKLVQAQARTEERLTRLEEAVERLVEAQARTDQTVEKLVQMQARTDQTVEKLVQMQARTEERLTRLEEAVERLVHAQARFERTFETKLGALGARWGLDTEESFRQGMRAILEDVGFRVERYLVYDKEGKVFDRPAQVELDVVVRDGKLMLIEIKSSSSRADVAIFNRKVRFYEEREGVKAARRMLISPFVEMGARELALALDTEIYTRADDLAKSQVEG